MTTPDFKLKAKWLDRLSTLPPHTRAEVLNAIFEYYLFDTTPADPFVAFAISAICEDLKRDKERHLKRQAKAAEQTATTCDVTDTHEVAPSDDKATSDDVSCESNTARTASAKPHNPAKTKRAKRGSTHKQIMTFRDFKRLNKLKISPQTAICDPYRSS